MISVTCKRHKNKPINWRYYGLPYVITDHESAFGTADKAGAMDFQEITFKDIPIVYLTGSEGKPSNQA